jgi:hypothetical protein
VSELPYLVLPRADTQWTGEKRYFATQNAAAVNANALSAGGEWTDPEVVQVFHKVRGEWIEIGTAYDGHFTHTPPVSWGRSLKPPKKRGKAIHRAKGRHRIRSKVAGKKKSASDKRAAAAMREKLKPNQPRLYTRGGVKYYAPPPSHRCTRDEIEAHGGCEWGTYHKVPGRFFDYEDIGPKPATVRRDVTVYFSTSDGHRRTRTFKTLQGAQKYAQERIGETPELGSYYAVSGFGDSKIEAKGATVRELFPASAAGEDDD